jgi:hypothetical protein
VQATAIAQELATRGYCVVGGFLSGTDISPGFIAHLESANKFFDGVITDIPAPEMAGIQKKIAALIPSVARELDLTISPDLYGYSAIRIRRTEDSPTVRKPFNVHQDPKIAPGGVLNWHLDHFSYYLHRDHTNWLICYMPVVKPSSKLANLAIIPKNVVEALDPELQRRIRGRGAMRFRCVEADTIDWFRLRFPSEALNVGDWFAIDDYEDSTMGWKIGFDLEQHKVVPELDEKDLLIMRADIIHRTNDADIDRISIRCDAQPAHAARLRTRLGLINLTLQYPFMGAKRRYNLKKWLQQAWTRALEPARFQ